MHNIIHALICTAGEVLEPFRIWGFVLLPVRTC